jgi:hypothetical protein
MAQLPVLNAPAGAPKPEPGDPLYELWNAPISGDSAGAGSADAPDSEAAAGVRLRQEAAEKPTMESVRQILAQLIPDHRNIPEDMVAARLDVMSQPGAADATPRVLWWSDPELRNQPHEAASTMLSGVSLLVLKEGWRFCEL